MSLTLIYNQTAFPLVNCIKSTFLFLLVGSSSDMQILFPVGELWDSFYMPIAQAKEES